MNRKIYRFLIIAVLMLALVACGGQTEPDVEPVEDAVAEPTEAPAEPTEAPAEPTVAPTDEPEPEASESEESEMAMDEDASGAFPVTIDHKFGSTTFEEKPERIVAIGYNEQDYLFALGEKPLAVRYWFGDAPNAIFPHAIEAADGAEPEVLEMTFGELNYEQILNFNPDMISAVYSGISEEEYEKLSAIAPVLAQSGDYNDFGMPWDATTMTIAEALGKTDMAEKLVAEVNDLREDVIANHPEFQGTEAVVGYVWEGAYGFYSEQDGRARFFTDLGFVIPEDMAEMAGDSFYAEVSAEALEMMDRDFLLFVSSTDLPNGADDIINDPLLSQLSVMKEGRYVIVPPEMEGTFNFNTVLSLKYLYEQLIPMMSDALGGDAMAGGGDAMAEGTTIEHKFGSTTFPAKPERVVTVGYSEQDAVLALGVQPVGVRDWFGERPFGVWAWSQEALGDAEPTLMQMPFGELNYELITELAPDVIIATHSGITEDEYNLLSEIAPVLAQPADFPDFGVPWQTQTSLIGQALGKAREAGELVGGVEGALAGASAVNNFGDATFAWANPFDGTYYVVGATTPPMRTLERLGLVNDPDVQAVVGDLDSAVFSEEQLDLLDVDVLILSINTQDDIKTFTEDPLLSSLDVFKEDRVIYLERTSDIYGALSFSTVGSIPFLVQELSPMISEKLGASGSMPSGESSGDGMAMADDVAPLPRTVVDYEGNEVVIEDDSALLPIDGPLTEIVYALGMGDLVIATDVSSTYPPEVTDLPQVGYVRSLSAEPILAVSPTLILTTDDAGPPEAVTQLQESGVTLVQFKAASTVEESMELVMDVAQALGVEERGEKLVAKMEADLVEAEKLLAEVEGTPRVMFVYARGLDTVSAAGYGTSVDVMFELAGVENAVTEWEGYQPLTAEGAVTVAPDAILMFESGLASVGGAEGMLGVPGIAETPAGEGLNIFAMDGLKLTGLGPRVGEAVIELIQMLHGE